MGLPNGNGNAHPSQVRSEVAHQTGGMLVRHVIDESSPLYRRTEEMLKKEDAVFKLSVVSRVFAANFVCWRHLCLGEDVYSMGRLAWQRGGQKEEKTLCLLLSSRQASASSAWAAW